MSAAMCVLPRGTQERVRNSRGDEPSVSEPFGVLLYLSCKLLRSTAINLKGFDASNRFSLADSDSGSVAFRN